MGEGAGGAIIMLGITIVSIYHPALMLGPPVTETPYSDLQLAKYYAPDLVTGCR